MMLERVLYQVLSDGLTALMASPEAVVQFFMGEGELSQEEAEKIADYFQKEPPHVVHGYARSDNKFPLVAITLGGEQETQTFLGDEGGFEDDPDSEAFGADQFAAIFSYTFNLLVYAQHPDVALYLSHLVKEVLIDSFPTLKSKHLFDLKISAADLGPDAAWAPAGLFLRRVTVTCSREYRQTLLLTRIGRAWKVQSIHVDRQGAVGTSPGDVLTHVTVAEEEG